MSLLEIKDLSLGYDGKVVVSGLNFTVESGDYLCVLGENGSGKSTLIKAILGLKSAYSGHIHFAEGFSRREIGYMPQKTDIQRDFPAGVFEVVLSGCQGAMGLKPFYTRAEKKRALAAMERLDISHIKNECYRDLSGGQQQRVLLARALCSADKLILLDEPTTALDPHATAEFYKIIGSLNREEGVTVMMVSHDTAGALENSTKVLHLGGRESLFFGDTKDYAKTRIGRKFLGGES